MSITEKPPTAELLPVPPLREGERLTREEFERRYEAMPHAKAELIEGVVHMTSPVRHQQHGRPNLRLGHWISVYELATPGVEGSIGSTVRLDQRNEPEPDLFLRIGDRHGGQSRDDEDGYVTGPPELAVEISASTTDQDLGAKLISYRRSGVREYLVWRVVDREIDWFVLRDGRYERLAPGEDGILRSEVFPGLWLDAEALLRGDMARVLEVLQQGLRSDEHAAFAASLDAAR